MSIAATKDKNFLVEEEIPCVTRERRIVVVQAQTKEEAMEKRSQEIKEDSGSVVRISKRATPIPVILFLGVTVLISYFDYHDDGFGPIGNTVPEVCSYLEQILQNGCQMDDTYKTRVKNFFTICDTKNSERTYLAVKEMIEKS